MLVFLDIAKTTWQLVTFPWPLLVLVFLGFGWLWVEKQITRLGRATPGLHGPIPVFSFVSSVVIVFVIWSKRLLYLWVLLFISLLMVFYLSHQSPNFPPELPQIAFKIGSFWHDSYAYLEGFLGWWLHWLTTLGQ